MAGLIFASKPVHFPSLTPSMAPLTAPHEVLRPITKTTFVRATLAGELHAAQDVVIRDIAGHTELKTSPMPSP